MGPAAAPGARPRANVLGVGIDALTLPRAVERVVDAARRRAGAYVCVTGVHGVMEAQRDPALRGILNGATLNTPDGMPMVWVGRAQGHDIARVYGPDLMLALCERSVAEGMTHFFYGGQEGVAETLRTRLEARFPGLRVVGTDTPPFRPLDAREEQELLARVEALRPDFFWVGLSTPKQERFMARYAGRVAAGVMLGVGAAFDMHAGRVRQAPRWMQGAGLEWLFRLAQEPRRLARRYLVNNPAFVVRLIQQALGLATYTVTEAAPGSSPAAPEPL